MIRAAQYLMILLIIFAYSENFYAQKKDSTFTARNTFYAGFTNEGAIYSINYDRIFSQNNKLAWSYRIGLSILENAIAMPIGINLFTGKGNSHAEFSFTVIPYVDKYRSFLSSDDLSDKYIYLIPGIGYRFQKPKGGIFFKALVSPTVFLDPPSSNFWKMDPKLKFLAHVGIGYSF
ncbi:MAG: hypothetical protein HC831_30345 [Chloroflexia bacterium]|nr:hypothetical protein [Chloroflexia bacterium]